MQAVRKTPISISTILETTLGNPSTKRASSIEINPEYRHYLISDRRITTNRSCNEDLNGYLKLQLGNLWISF